MSVDLISQQIERMTLEVPERARRCVKDPELHVGSRALAIRDLLSKNAQYEINWPLAQKVLQFMDAVKTPHSSAKALAEFRSSLKSVKPRSLLTPIREALDRLLPCIWGSGDIIEEPSEGGCGLKHRVSEEHVKTMDKDTFWNMIKGMDVSELQIDRFQKLPWVYSGYVLDRLVVNKVELSALTEEFTLRFDTGEIIEGVTRAFLSLCGKFFTRNSFQVFKESVNGVIEVPGVSINGFCGILAMVNNRELDEDIIFSEYIHCKNELSFSELDNSGIRDNRVKCGEVVDNSIHAVKEVGMDVLPRLSGDVLRRIFANVSNNTFLNCRLVCRDWNSATLIKAAWENRIFPLTISPGNIPQFAIFFSPLHYDKDDEQWQNIKDRIRDIVHLAKGGHVGAQVELAQRILLKKGNYNIAYGTALEWLRNEDNPKVDYVLGVDYVNLGVVDNAIRRFRSSAEKGYSPAQNCMGMYYYEGKELKKDLLEAAKWFLLSAEQGYVYAQANLGALHSDSNKDEALKWSLRAGCQGYARAQNRVGVILYDRSRDLNDISEALIWLKRAADQDFHQAQYNLGYVYQTDQDIRDLKEAAKWYRLAAQAGHAEAQYKLGLLYQNGQGVTKDLEEAIKWYRLAAEQGICLAEYALGKLYLDDDGVPVNFEEAFKWHHLAAEQGNCDAQYSVYQMYKEGKGIVADSGVALRWLRSAAEQGHVEACAQLGALYKEGNGVPVNLPEAFKWYRSAAKKGHVEAQYILGTMYENGLGVDVNLKEAFNCYWWSAQEGYKLAQYRLGYMYQHGVYMTKDIKAALKWYEFAALGEFGTAKDKMELEALIVALRNILNTKALLLNAKAALESIAQNQDKPQAVLRNELCTHMTKVWQDLYASVQPVDLVTLVQDIKGVRLPTRDDLVDAIVDAIVAQGTNLNLVESLASADKERAISRLRSAFSNSGDSRIMLAKQLLAMGRLNILSITQVHDTSVDYLRQLIQPDRKAFKTHESLNAALKIAIEFLRIGGALTSAEHAELSLAFTEALSKHRPYMKLVGDNAFRLDKEFKKICSELWPLLGLGEFGGLAFLL